MSTARTLVVRVFDVTGSWGEHSHGDITLVMGSFGVVRAEAPWSDQELLEYHTISLRFADTMNADKIRVVVPSSLYDKLWGKLELVCSLTYDTKGVPVSVTLKRITRNDVVIFNGEGWQT